MWYDHPASTNASGTFQHPCFPPPAGAGQGGGHPPGSARLWRASHLHQRTPAGDASRPQRGRGRVGVIPLRARLRRARHLHQRTTAAPSGTSASRPQRGRARVGARPWERAPPARSPPAPAHDSDASRHQRFPPPAGAGKSGGETLGARTSGALATCTSALRLLPAGWHIKPCVIGYISAPHRLCGHPSLAVFSGTIRGVIGMIAAERVPSGRVWNPPLPTCPRIVFFRCGMNILNQRTPAAPSSTRASRPQRGRVKVGPYPGSARLWRARHLHQRTVPAASRVIKPCVIRYIAARYRLCGPP
ncbi:MAG: hypothetical protein KatS3mg023_4044 [Armatimonadota bacterium]|nr:MAG: hypothetical protein KatS3mg023_4044 [Armatimonadota bacterium]